MKSTAHTCHRLPNLGQVSPQWMLLIICLFLGTSSETFALDRTISLTNGCALPGVTSQIEIRLSDVEGLAGCDLEIAFDPEVISILDVNTTPVTRDFFLSFGGNTSGNLRVAMASAEGLTAGGPGAIATVTVEMASNSEMGARTALLYRGARWYTELSARQNLLGDNAVFEAGTVTPAEDGGIVFFLDPCHGQPGNIISSGVWVSLPAGVARMEGTLTYDTDTLLSPSLVEAPELTGWSQVVQYESGQIHFIFSGATELSGPDPIQIASCTWMISPDAVLGSQSDIAVNDPQATNLGDFGYLCLGQPNIVAVDVPVPTPTPTATFTPTATPTPEPLLVNSWEEY